MSEKTQQLQDLEKKSESAPYDLWAPVGDPLAKIVEKYPEIDKDYLIPLKQSINPPNKRIPTLVAAVEPPKQGASYNPSFEAHQELLKEAVEEQLKKRKELKDIMAKLKAEQKRDWDPDAEVDPLFTENGANENSSDEDDGIPEHVFNPHIPRKLQAERNKEARKKKKRNTNKGKNWKKKKEEFG